MAVGKNTKNAMERMLKNIGLMVFICIALPTFAQDSGKVKFNMDYDILSGYNRYKNAIDSNKIQGYRIQVFYGNDRSQADKVLYEVKTKFHLHEDEADKIYESPAYKVRVGNFYQEVDAQALLQEIRKDYPGAFLVRSTIKLPRQTTTVVNE